MNTPRPEALRVLAALVADPNGTPAAADLLIAVRRDRVSEKQGAWIDRLVYQFNNPAPTLDLSRVLKAYQALPAETKRFPKMRTVLTIGGLPTEVLISYVSPSSDKAKPENLGTCGITSGKYGTPENRWYGRIATSGQFIPGRDLCPEVIDWLTGLSKAKPKDLVLVY